MPELRMRSGTSYSDKLVEVVERCMALDPLARPQSVFELQTALANYQCQQLSSRLTCENTQKWVSFSQSRDNGKLNFIKTPRK